jgi:hypothetical protein
MCSLFPWNILPALVLKFRKFRKLSWKNHIISFKKKYSCKILFEELPQPSQETTIPKKMKSKFRWRLLLKKYSCVQKFSNKHNFDHNFFVLQSFGFKFSGNLYTYSDYNMFSKIWTNRTHAKVFEQVRIPLTLWVLVNFLQFFQAKLDFSVDLRLGHDKRIKKYRKRERQWL